jgi:flagellar basal body rod protein FlgC
MSSILNIAVSGLNAAAARVATAANNIVNASSTNFTPQDIVSISNSAGGVSTKAVARPTTPGTPGNGVDIASELVSTIAAQTDYGANAVIVKAEKKMDQTLLDILT